MQGPEFTLALLSRWCMQLEVLTAERDNLREDLRGTRDAKRLADQSWRTQNAKLNKVEAELAFYQKEAANAVSDRDRVSDCSSAGSG